jgi:hypothetical protein
MDYPVADCEEEEEMVDTGKDRVLAVGVAG